MGKLGFLLSMMRLVEVSREKALVTLLLFLVVEVGIVSIGVDVVAGDYEKISLEGIRENPENYLEVEVNETIVNYGAKSTLYANFTVISVSEPFNFTDVFGNEWEICKVVLKDSYNYHLQFYISSKDYQNHTLWVGESAPFNISIGDGPYYESWSLGLVINRIAYKPHSNYHAAYSAYIYLVPSQNQDSSFSWWIPLTIGTIAATTLALTALAFQRLKKKGEVYN